MNYKCATDLRVWRMIPVDCLRIIVDYSRLRERYLWSIVHKDFEFVDGDWVRFSEYYRLGSHTRAGIKELCQRAYQSQILISRLERHLWSNHLREPLRIWSPWTPGKFCKRYSRGCSMLFRHYSFVNFVRDITVKFKLKSSLLKQTSVNVNIWNKTIPMVYISNSKRVKKVHISSAFKAFNVARALLVFHVRNDVLYLHPQRLEFLT